MDVNAIDAQKANSAFFVASPVDGAPALEVKQAEPAPKPKPVSDMVDISLKPRERSAYQVALEVQSKEQARSGSKVFKDETTDRIVVKILNANNEEIRQIPSDEELRIFSQFIRVTGALFDELG